MSFDNLIGNEPIKVLLRKNIENNKLTHSYMFVGPSGIGKTLFAREFAKIILCQNNDENCSSCKSCLELANNNNPDLIQIQSQDGKIKIEQIREMQKKVLEKPIISNKKVYIIKDADQMTNEAANCLLKTLEEPPEYITIVLIGTNESLFLNTIRSRCTKILFNKLQLDEMKKYIQKHSEFSNISENVLNLADGSIEKLIKISEKIDLYTNIENVFNNIENYNIIKAMQKLEVMYKEKDSIYEILDYINVILFNKSKNDSKFIRYIEAVEQTKIALKANANYDMSIDNLLYKIWEE